MSGDNIVQTVAEERQSLDILSIQKEAKLSASEVDETEKSE